MSIARPLTGPEVKICLIQSFSEALKEIGLPSEMFRPALEGWLDAQSALSRPHLTYPRIKWEIETMIETPRREVGKSQSLQPYVSAHVEADLGNNFLLTRRFGESAPIDLDCDVTIGKSWQLETRVPDDLRARWIKIEDKVPDPQETESANQTPSASEMDLRKFRLAPEDLPSEDLLGTPPTSPEVISEGEEEEMAEIHSPAPEEETSSAPRAGRRGRPKKQVETS